MKSQRHELSIATSIAPAAHTATVNGTAVDLSGCNEATVLFNVGTITDGTHTPVVQESADGTTWTDVPAASLGGTLANLTSNTDQKVDYMGTKRYIRARVTVAGAATGGVYGAVVIRGDLRKQPAA